MSAPPKKTYKSLAEKICQAKQTLAPGDLKERLPEIEAKTLEIEKETKEIFALEEENRHLEERLKMFNRAVFSIIYHATQPGNPEFVERQMEVLAAGLSQFKEDAK